MVVVHGDEPREHGIAVRHVAVDYRFMYVNGTRVGVLYAFQNQFVKIDVTTAARRRGTCRTATPASPFLCLRRTQAEDDSLVLSAVLDAHIFNEIARAEVPHHSLIYSAFSYFVSGVSPSRRVNALHDRDVARHQWPLRPPTVEF